MHGHSGFVCATCGTTSPQNLTYASALRRSENHALKYRTHLVFPLKAGRSNLVMLYFPHDTDACQGVLNGI